MNLQVLIHEGIDAIHSDERESRQVQREASSPSGLLSFCIMPADFSCASWRHGANSSLGVNPLTSVELPAPTLWPTVVKLLSVFPLSPFLYSWV